MRLTPEQFLILLGGGHEISVADLRARSAAADDLLAAAGCDPEDYQEVSVNLWLESTVRPDLFDIQPVLCEEGDANLLADTAVEVEQEGGLEDSLRARPPVLLLNTRTREVLWAEGATRLRIARREGRPELVTVFVGLFGGGPAPLTPRAESHP